MINTLTSRERFVKATQLQFADRPPAWVMRQAGRYLPEYQELKQQYTFGELIRTPDLATEVTLQPLRRYEQLDAAIIFSDILVISEALGLGYEFHPERGLTMEYALDTEDKIHALDPQGVEEKLAYVPTALRLVRDAVPGRALLGFAGAPWTLAMYMIEGSSTSQRGGTAPKIKSLAWENPQLFEVLMEKITQATIVYLNAQIETGIDALQLFDSNAAQCPGNCYEEYSLKWIRKIIQGLPEGFPVILFAKGMSHHSEALLSTGARVLSLDSSVSVGDYLAQYPQASFGIQGNIDNELLLMQPETIQRVLTDHFKVIDRRPGYIFNLGHGILPMTPPENLQVALETLDGYYR